jgi:hypothetical protein
LTKKGFGYIFIIGGNKGRSPDYSSVNCNYMPRIDGTGPVGQGPLSGRGMGRCGSGMRQGSCGHFGGFGMGRRFYSPKNELSALQEEEQFLRDELAAVQEEINAVKAQK